METLFGTIPQAGCDCAVCHAKIGLVLIMDRGEWCLYRLLDPVHPYNPSTHTEVCSPPLLRATTFLIAQLAARHWFEQDPLRRFVLSDPMHLVYAYPASTEDT